jgi:hypothetical protein
MERIDAIRTLERLQARTRNPDIVDLIKVLEFLFGPVLKRDGRPDPVPAKERMRRYRARRKALREANKAACDA